MANIESLIQKEVAPAMNAHNVDKVMQYFDDNATINFAVPPPGFPGTLKGKAQIKNFMERFIPGFHTEPRDFKTTGDRVEWSATLSSDLFKQAGLDTVEGKVSATVKNNKIVSFNPSFSAETIEKLRKAKQN